MQLQCQIELDRREPFELLVLPFWEGGEAAVDVSHWKTVLAGPLNGKDFLGKVGETVLVYEPLRIILLGLGKKEKITRELLRRAYASVVKVAQTKNVQSIHCMMPRIDTLSSEESLKAVAEGVALTNYAFFHLKHDSLAEEKSHLLERVIFVGLDRSHEKMLTSLLQVMTNVYWVRDLVNNNADEVTPKMLAQAAASLAKEDIGLHATILDKKAIEQEKMGLLLAVNRGSALDPQLIQLSYRGNPTSSEHIVLVGKGITYDTGGLALKPAEGIGGMLTMKSDMAGAATVLGAVHAAALLRLNVNVTALCPVTENAIDAKSYKNGDVYRSMSGKMVEVINTDAEGRLVLADALTYALKHLHPTEIIDIASLTGAIVVALGDEMAGLFCNQDQFAQKLLASAERTGELMWRMPLHSDYKELLKSDIADIANCASVRSASAVTAALFLQEFVGTIPWAHIDFAGICYQTKPKYYYPTKATGFGVRLLVDFLEQRSS